MELLGLLAVLNSHQNSVKSFILIPVSLIIWILIAETQILSPLEKILISFGNMGVYLLRLVHKLLGVRIAIKQLVPCLSLLVKHFSFLQLLILSILFLSSPNQLFPRLVLPQI